MDDKKNKLAADVIERMKKRAQEVVQAHGVRDTDLFARYKEMFFMSDEARRPLNGAVDDNDWAVTISPATRNEVVGMKRLLDTSEIHVTAKSGGQDATAQDKIEKALLSMLRVSGEFRRARVESDAALSAVLYSPVVLYAESVDDLMKVRPEMKSQLEKIRRRSPFLIRSINPEQSYPEWGEFGLISHVWKYTLRGAALRERWGEGANDLKNDLDYTVYDIFDTENRLVYVEGVAGELFAGAHGLAQIPICVSYAGGSSLFSKPEEQMQSFLYAKAKSKLDRRENALLTAIATAVNMRGLLGPLLAIDPESVQAQDEISVDYTAGVRYIKAKAQQVDDKVIDPVVFQWRAMLQELSAESTVYKQTLGENIAHSTFSGLAMLSNSGKLPLVDAQRAMSLAFRDVFLNILERIRDEGIDNPLIAPTEIPDDVELDVVMEAVLPQDKMRNAQIAASLGDLVSDEWKRGNLLQVGDSPAMTRQVIKEQLLKAAVQGMMQNPEVMQNILAPLMPQVQGQGQGMPPTGGGGKMPQMQGGQGQGMPGGMPASAQGGMPPEMMAMMQGGQGMEGMPQTDAMLPPEERL